MMQDVEKHLHRLATAKNLTPAELKTRKAIAVIAKSIDEAQLQPVALPQLTATEDDTEDAPAK